MKSWWLPPIAKAALCWCCISQPVHAECYEEAGSKYGISPVLLRAIAITESNENPFAVSPVNRNGTRDYGKMQISSWWFDKIKQYGIEKKDLFNACQNVHVGAWVLAQSIQLMGNNWDAVGAYNAGPGRTREKARLRKIYADKVWANYVKLTGQ